MHRLEEGRHSWKVRFPYWHLGGYSFFIIVFILQGVPDKIVWPGSGQTERGIRGASSSH